MKLNKFNLLEKSPKLYGLPVIPIAFAKAQGLRSLTNPIKATTERGILESIGKCLSAPGITAAWLETKDHGGYTCYEAARLSAECAKDSK